MILSTYFQTAWLELFRSSLGYPQFEQYFGLFPYLGVSEQDAVHVMRRVLDQLVVGVEDNEANLAVAEDA